MKSVRSEGCWNDPSMMRFMESFINERMMQTTMNPINQTIRKYQEKRELKYHVPPSIFFWFQIKFRIPSNFGQEPGSSEHCHLG